MGVNKQLIKRYGALQKIKVDVKEGENSSIDMFSSANIEYVAKEKPAPKAIEQPAQTDTQMLVEVIELLLLDADVKETKELNELIEVIYLLDEGLGGFLGAVKQTKKAIEQEENRQKDKLMRKVFAEMTHLENVREEAQENGDFEFLQKTQKYMDELYTEYEDQNRAHMTRSRNAFLWIRPRAVKIPVITQPIPQAQSAPAQTDTQMLVEVIELLLLDADAQETKELNELIEVIYLLD